MVFSGGNDCFGNPKSSLYVNQQDYALYNNNTFVLSINKEVFELLQKQLKNFSVKAFDVSGVRLEFFKRYRQFLRKDDSSEWRSMASNKFTLAKEIAELNFCLLKSSFLMATFTWCSHCLTFKPRSKRFPKQQMPELTFTHTSRIPKPILYHGNTKR